MQERLGQQAHECREQALAAQVELLTHRLVECRMVNDVLQRQHLDDVRRMHEQGLRTAASPDPLHDRSGLAIPR